MTAMDSAVGIVGYLALFVGVGFAFIFVNLLVGRFLRPHNPNTEKLEIYECGEPTIGSSFVQFDLRFYVVALVFIIFDVEVAFLFPWATVFGKVSNLMREPSALVESSGDELRLTPLALDVYHEMGLPAATPPAAATPRQSEQILRDGLRGENGTLDLAGLQQILTLAVIAAAIFFFVLFVGFAYEWRTGALDWVRAMTRPSSPSSVVRIVGARGSPQESLLSA